MAGDMNRATLIGRLGGDPESRSTQDGKRVVSFSIATGESWRDKHTGERRERTQWHRVVIWNESVGKIAEQYLRKGSKCLVEECIETREWEDRDNTKKRVTEIVLRNFDARILLLDGKSDRDDRGDDRPARRDDGSAAKSSGEEFADDIPF